MNKRIYLDNAATTPMKKEVLEAMIPYFIESFGNPSANYVLAKDANQGVEKARLKISQLINCNSEEIFFTSGGTESDNWAIKGIADRLVAKGKHIITTSIEHHAVLSPLHWLETKGYTITYLKVNKSGLIDIGELEASIRPDTILISIMFANNEIGTIQPIERIGQVAQKHKILFHTDAVQAFGHVPIDVKKMKIDLLSASGHKINGPKGVGILYIKKGIKIESLMHGGSQEHGKRGGTYNVPGIVGMGTAAAIAKEIIGNTEILERRDYFIHRIIREIPLCYLNGDEKNRLPNNINVRFDDVDAESLLVMLEQYGIYASVGSACTTGQVEPSHVLLSIGLTKEQAHNSIRLTISGETSIEQIDYTVAKMEESIAILRGTT